MISKPKGTYDVLPEEARVWAKIETIIRKICALSNYEEIRTPIFESAKVFHRDESDSSDMVNKETYDFLDRGNREMTLRPEGTAGVVRSYIENKLYVNQGTTKLFYLGPMFRYERQQKGRYRQFSQFGLEAFGSDSPLLDVDIITTAINLLEAIGLKGIRVRINTLGDKESRDRYRDVLVEYFSKHIDSLCSDCHERLAKNPLRILDCKVDKDSEILANCPKISDYLNDASKAHFNTVLDTLRKMNIDYVVDEKLVRGLDYYSNTVFELEYTSEDFGSQNVICAGGRYNNLVKDLGGPETSAVGLAFGIDRLILALEHENKKIVKDKMLHAYLITLGDEAFNYGSILLNDLRKAGFMVDMDYSVRSLKGQFKLADKNSSRFVLILGEDELNNNTINVKDQVSGNQETVKLDELKEYLLSHFVSKCQGCKGENHE